jgi:hypothetical protein
MTRDECHTRALELKAAADAITPIAHPERLALLAGAQFYATLALSAPATKTTTTPRKTAAKKVAESKETSK